MSRAELPKSPSSTGNVPASPAVLQARQLGFAVAGRTLWRDLALTLHAGERVALAGASGSGKTLLLRTLAGLEPLQQGELIFQGRRLPEWSMPAYRARVAYLPQRPALPEGSVEDALRAPFRFHVHRHREFRAGRARKLLARLGRGERFLQQRTEQLSGGELQIVTLLRALLIGPDVLLLDEPTASLDADAVAAVEALVIAWLHEDPQRASLWASHDRQQLQRVGDRVLTLDTMP